MTRLLHRRDTDDPGVVVRPAKAEDLLRVYGGSFVDVYVSDTLAGFVTYEPGAMPWRYRSAEKSGRTLTFAAAVAALGGAL